MDYAHVSKIKPITDDEALKIRFDRWVEAQKRPYAKLMRGFYRTGAIAEFLKKSGFDYSALEDASNYGDSASEGAVFSFKNLIFPKEERSALWREVQKQLYECMDKKSLEAESLNKLGCPVFLPMWHSYKITDEKNTPVGTGVDIWFFLPLQKPNESFGHETIGMPPQPRTLPNFEGQVTFLAYLMRKGYVTEADAPRGENPAAPFSAAMFGFAKTRAKTLTLETP